jgi:hypothetical protein
MIMFIFYAIIVVLGSEWFGGKPKYMSHVWNNKQQYQSPSQLLD